jgi:hypothetical protein
MVNENFIVKYIRPFQPENKKCNDITVVIILLHIQLHITSAYLCFCKLIIYLPLISLKD